MADHQHPKSQHPLLMAARAVETTLTASVNDVTAASTWSAETADVEDALTVLARCRARLTALEHLVLEAAESVQIGSASGATSTGARWADLTRQTRARSIATVKHAHVLRERHPSLAQALQAGSVLPEQAEVIAKAVDALPVDTVPADVIGQARAHLLALAAKFDARDLTRLGRHVLDVVAPDIAETVERDRLEREEAAARAAASFTMTKDGRGKAHGRFTLPVAEADMLLVALDALTAPRHHHATYGSTPLATDQHGDRLPREQRRGQAFCEYVRTRHQTGGRRPQAGGVDATVVVSLTMAQLTGQGDGAHAPVTLSTGATMTAGKARLWACGAGIVPVVLGGQSQPLDVGRVQRYFTRYQRLVLAKTQGGCTADGCDWPPSMCHAHHRTPWACGGRTDLAEGYLLCPRHHARAHDPAYETTYHHHRVTFARIRPTRT